MSPLFINDQGRDECVFEDVMVLVADVEIGNILQIENVLKPIIQEGKKLLIVANCHVNVVLQQVLILLGQVLHPLV